MESQNAYQVLGIQKGATEEEINTAWRELVKVYDPERHTDRFILIDGAYKKLRDPAKRAREDILAFNFIKGGFKFTADEQTREPDALINQLLQRQEQACNEDPNSAEAQAAFVKALMMRSFKKTLKKQWKEAIEDWQRILATDLAHQRAKHNLLYAYMTLGYSYAIHELYDAATELWEKALQMNPDDDLLMHNLAIANEKAGNQELSKRYWAETLRRWQLKLEKDPDDAYTRNCIVEVRRHHGGQTAQVDGQPVDKATSIKEYKEILKINPNDFEAQYKIAIAYYEQQNWAEGVKALSNLLKSYPKNVEVHNMLGWALLQSGQVEQSFQIWNRSLTIDPNNNSTREAIVKARMDMGKLCRNRGMHTQALVHFKALLRFLPKSAELFLEIGHTYMTKGDKRSAALAFEQAIALDPKSRAARQFLSDMKLRT